MFPGKLGIQQRVIPSYRATFFEALSTSCQGGLSVFAGQPLSDESITSIVSLQSAHYVTARNWHFLNPASSFYLCWQAGITSWLAEWEPDVLVVEANPRYLSTRLAIRWMHSRGREVLGWGLGSQSLQGILAGVRGWARQRFLHKLEGVIAYSHNGATEYRALGFPSQKVFVATNAVAPRPSSIPPQRPPNFSERPMILFVGRLQARKRVDYLLRACADLPSQLQPRLVIVGEGPERAELQSMANQHYPHAEFTGALHGKELVSYYEEADLFVLPGTGGLAVQQAMAFGLPIVVARGDGTQDDLVRSENGWQVPTDNLPALLEAIKEALADPLRLRRMGLESYRIVAEEINLETMVRAFVEAINTIHCSSSSIEAK